MHKDPFVLIAVMMTQMKGPSAKYQDEPQGEERARTGPEKAQAGQPVRTGPTRFFGASGPPLLGVKFVQP
jgi:hypothetical protein